MNILSHVFNPVQAKDSDDDDDVTVTVDRDRFMDEFFEQVGARLLSAPSCLSFLTHAPVQDSHAPNPCSPSSPSCTPRGGGTPV